MSRQALAHTAELTPAGASDLIAAKDNASKTGNRDRARESIGRLSGRPATLHNGRLTIELDNGKRHIVRSEIFLMLQALVDGGAVANGQRLAVVLTKQDVVQQSIETPSPRCPACGTQK